MPPASGVKIKLNGKQATLRYTMPALNRLEDERGGESLGETLSRAGQMSSRAITALVWAGRLHEDADLTMDAVAESIAPPFTGLVLSITEALTPWLKDDADEGKAPAAS
jgi:hypothetical protein